MTYYTYILYSNTSDRFYYGQTSDLESRLKRHNSGLVKSTSKFTSWRIYAYKELVNRSGSIKMERKLKNLKSRKRVQEFILKNDFKIMSV